MNSNKWIVIAALMCFGLSLEAQAKNGVKVDKATKEASKVQEKTCIADIKAKLEPIKAERDASCVTEADEETPVCEGLKEQISALKSQIKECKGK